MTSDIETQKPARFSLFWSGVGAFCVLSILACDPDEPPPIDRFGRLKYGGYEVSFGTGELVVLILLLVGVFWLVVILVKIVRRRRPLPNAPKAPLRNKKGLKPHPFIKYMQRTIGGASLFRWLWYAFWFLFWLAWIAFFANSLWSTYRHMSAPSRGYIGSSGYPVWHLSEAQESPWWLREISVMGYDPAVFEKLQEFPHLEKLWVESPMRREAKERLRKALPDVEIIFCDDPHSGSHYEMTKDQELKAMIEYHFGESRQDLVDEIIKTKLELDGPESSFVARHREGIEAFECTTSPESTMAFVNDLKERINFRLGKAYFQAWLERELARPEPNIFVKNLKKYGQVLPPPQPQPAERETPGDETETSEKSE